MNNAIDLPNKPVLSVAHQETLRQQVIDQDNPGIILRDFFALMDFIGPKGIQVTGQYHLLPLRCLSDLNARMTFPLQLGLKRPQQKSYPHINGLYLLLRGTGLTRLDARGPKSRLVLDEAVLSFWAELSPTEQYFTLLESWMLRADPGVLGDREGIFKYDHPIYGWSQFFKQVPDQGLIIAGNKAAEEDLRYFPKLHNLALLELFGFVTVQPNPPKPKVGWQIGRIWRTPLGEAMLELLYQTLANNVHSFLVDDTSIIPFGTLQPVIQPHFPAWQRNLVIPGHEFQPGLHIFKVALGTDLWRHISIPGHLTLNILSGAILDAYEFDHDHLDCFTYTDRFGVSRHIYHPYMEEEAVSTDEV
ncbi:plasmid pRiA4b ORF-3 family protein, partial [Chloroflexota bacterium]